MFLQTLLLSIGSVVVISLALWSLRPLAQSDPFVI
jgi:hypothetical protein